MYTKQGHHYYAAKYTSIRLDYVSQIFLPTPIVKGEPAWGGVAGMFLGGSGGGAVT